MQEMKKENRSLYVAGGISLIAIGAILLFVLPLLAVMMPVLLATSIPSALNSLNSLALPDKVFFALLAVNDLLYLVAFAALYYAVRSARGSLPLLALLFILIAVSVDLATDIPLHFVVLSTASSYASASTTASQSAYAASGSLALGLGNAGGLIAQLPLSIAEIMIGYAMLKRKEFGKFAGWSGIGAGALTLPIFPLMGSAGGLVYIIGFVFNIVWSFSAGLKLYRL